MIVLGASSFAHAGHHAGDFAGESQMTCNVTEKSGFGPKLEVGLIQEGAFFSYVSNQSRRAGCVIGKVKGTADVRIYENGVNTSKNHRNFSVNTEIDEILAQENLNAGNCLKITCQLQ